MPASVRPAPLQSAPAAARTSRRDALPFGSPRAPRFRSTPFGTVTTTASDRTVLKALRDAAAAGQQVTIRLTRAGTDQNAPLGKYVIVASTSPEVMQGKGLNPADVLAYLRQNGGVKRGLGNLWLGAVTGGSTASDGGTVGSPTLGAGVPDHPVTMSLDASHLGVVSILDGEDM